MADPSAVKRYAERLPTQREHAREVRHAQATYREFSDPRTQEQLPEFMGRRGATSTGHNHAMVARISDERSARAARLGLGNPVRSYPMPTTGASMAMGISLVLTILFSCALPPIALILAVIFNLALLALLLVFRRNQRVWLYDGGLLDTTLTGKVQFAVRWADIRSVDWQQHHIVTLMSLFGTMSRTEFVLRVAKGYTVTFETVKQPEPDELGYLIAAKIGRRSL